MERRVGEPGGGPAQGARRPEFIEDGGLGRDKTRSPTGRWCIYSPVSWQLHRRHGSFPYTGTIHQVTYVPGPSAPDTEEVRLAELREIGMGLE